MFAPVMKHLKNALTILTIATILYGVVSTLNSPVSLPGAFGNSASAVRASPAKLPPVSNVKASKPQRTISKISLS